MNDKTLLLGIILCGIIALLRYNQHLVQTSLQELDLFIDPECECVSDSTGKLYNFCYTDPQNSSSKGKKFDCAFVKVLEDLNLLTPESLITLHESIQNEADVVFVSAATDDHFDHTLNSYQTIRSFYPNHKYIFYGLGLGKPSEDRIPKDSNFEFRKFNTTPYPDYVKNLKKYHFKGLVLAEALRDFPVVFWIDAHQVIKKPDMLKSLFWNISESRMAKSFSPINSFVMSGHSNLAVLHPDLLLYFPSNSVDLLKKEQQVGSGIIFVPRTKETLEIVKWWVLCSLTEACINPPGSQLSCFGQDRYNLYANCFRYDQSVLNLLLLNQYQGYDKYFIRSMVEHFFE